MDPTTARYLVESHQSDFLAEAARGRLARQARRTPRQDSKPNGSTGLRAATRQLVASLLPIA